MGSISIASVPPEVILLIASYLTTPSLIAMKSTQRRFYNLLPPEPNDIAKRLSPCERYVVQRYIRESRYLADGRRVCVVCDQPKSLDRFPIDRPAICHDHGRFLNAFEIPEYLDAGMRRRLHASRARRASRPQWVSFERLLCAHGQEQEVAGWDSDGFTCACEPGCHITVKCFVRVPSLCAPRRKVLVDGGKFVREEYDFHGGSLPIGITITLRTCVANEGAVPGAQSPVIRHELIDVVSLDSIPR